MSKKFLAVVRAGQDTIHKNWCLPDVSPDYDVAVSYYGDGEYVSKSGEIVHYCKGGKWSGIHDFFQKNPQTLSQYTHFWLPDDDIRANALEINTLFRLCKDYDLAISQPSLTWNSNCVHFIVLQNPHFKLRYTNFVEIMAPVLSAEMLKTMLPYFEGVRFGQGLDFLWTRLMAQPRRKCAIIDAIAVEHVRPLGTSSLYQNSEFSPSDETKQLFQRLGLEAKFPHQVVYDAIDAQGHELRRGVKLWYKLYAGWRGLRRSPVIHPNQSHKVRWVFRNSRRYALRRYDLSPISFASRE